MRADIDAYAPEVVLDLVLSTEAQARELVALLRGRAGRVVAASSADVYRNYDGLRGRGAASPDTPPLSEEAPLRESRHPYRVGGGGDAPDVEHAHDYEKILVEQVLGDAPDLPATLLRLPAVYGPGDRQRRLRPYLGRMGDDGAPLQLGEAQARWRWTRGFVENVAAALALAATDRRAAGRIYNVGDEPTPREREWVEWIGEAAGWIGEVVVVPEADLPTSLRLPLDWRYSLWTDTSRIRRELGYSEPVPREEALARTVAWERTPAPA